MTITNWSTYFGGGITIQENALDPFEEVARNFLSSTSKDIVAQAFCSVADLVGLVGTHDGQSIFVASYYSTRAYLPGQSGGGVFVWKEDQAKSTHNGITIISPTVPWAGTQATLSAFQSKTGETSPSGTGCWVRQYDELYFEMAGTVGDKTTDDSPAIQKLATVLGNLGGGTAGFSGQYLIDANLTLPDCVSLIGDSNLYDELHPFASADYDSKTSLLIINSSATITLGDGAALGHCLIMRKGLNLPFADAAAATAGVAAFAGTAVTAGGRGAYFHHAMVLGFERAFTSASLPRGRVEYVIGDCTNGIRMDNSLDVSHINNCHFWPFTTVHQSWTTNALLVRTGTAYEFVNTADMCKMTDCFSFGYEIGFDINDIQAAHIAGCAADYISTLTSTSKGFYVRGNSFKVVLDRPVSSGQGTGIEIDSTYTTDLAVEIISPSSWICDDFLINIKNGRTKIRGGILSLNSKGVNIDPNSDGADIDGLTFEGVTTPWTGSGTGWDLTSIYNCTYKSCTDTVGVKRVINAQSQNNKTTVHNASGLGHNIIGAASRGTAEAKTVSISGDTVLRLSGQAYDGSAFGDLGYIKFLVDGSPSAGSTPGKVAIGTTASGSTTPSDAVIIDKNGKVGFGSSPVSGSVTAFGNITGATSAYGYRQQGSVKSDVTSTAVGYSNSLATEAAAFTLSNANHFRAEQGTIGLGSTVTNQMGFVASSTLTGATSNYGFYGNIASAANCWNFYAVGTARNFMAGRLDVGGTARTGSVAPSLTNPTNFYSANATYTDGNTAASGTVSHVAVNSFDNPALAAANATVTYTNASTVYIDGEPTASTNITITNPYALYTASGSVSFNHNSSSAGVAITQSGSGFGLNVSGSIGFGAPVTKTADFTVGNAENILINNKSGSACVVTLPSAATYAGRVITIKTIQAQTVDSAASNVIPLAGGAAGTAILSATAGKWADLISNGTNWEIMRAG